MRLRAHLRSTLLQSLRFFLQYHRFSDSSKIIKQVILSPPCCKLLFCKKNALSSILPVMRYLNFAHPVLVWLHSPVKFEERCIFNLAMLWGVHLLKCYLELSSVYFLVGPLPDSMGKKLLWRNSTLTPNVVKRALMRSNFRILTSTCCTAYCNGY